MAIVVMNPRRTSEFLVHWKVLSAHTHTHSSSVLIHPLRVSSNKRSTNWVHILVYPVLRRRRGSARSPSWKLRGRALKPSGSSTSTWNSECFDKTVSHRNKKPRENKSDFENLTSRLNTNIKLKAFSVVFFVLVLLLNVYHCVYSGSSATKKRGTSCPSSTSTNMSESL